MIINSEIEKLSNEELFKLAKEDNYIKEYFFERNNKFCFHIAKKFTNIVEQNEGVSLCNIGMLKAFNTFDPDKGNKFATYSARVMSNEILMHSRKMKKEPPNMDSLDREVTIGKENDTVSLLDMISYTDENLENLENSQLFSQAIDLLKNKLSDRDFNIFKEMFFEGKKQREVGEKYNITQSYISRIVGKALNYLKKNANKLIEPERNVVRVRKSKISLEAVQFIKGKYPYLKPSHIAKVFDVSTQTIRNKFKEDMAKELFDSTVEKELYTDKKVKELEKINSSLEQKETERIKKIVKEEKKIADIDEKRYEDERNKSDNSLKEIIKDSTNVTEEKHNSSFKESFTVNNVISTSKDITILNTQFSNTSNRDEIAAMIYGLYAMVNGVPIDSEVKIDISIQAVKKKD